MPKKLSVTIDAPAHKSKRPSPKRPFAKGNQFAWKPGTSGNPSGRPKDELRLVSRALRGQLGAPAPAEVCRALGLGVNASYAQVLGASIIRRAVSGDMAAARLVFDVTEGTRAKLGTTDLPDGDAPSRIEVFLVSPATGKPEPVTIEAAQELPAE